jgi:hypothetical protein
VPDTIAGVPDTYQPLKRQAGRGVRHTNAVLTHGVWSQTPFQDLNKPDDRLNKPDDRLNKPDNRLAKPEHLLNK